MKIEEPYLTEIRSIIKRQSDSDAAVYNLKLYMLEHSDYFNKILPRLDVGWLAKQIYLQHKKTK